MLTPLSPGQWDRAKAAHLLNRAGFGGPPEQIDDLAQGGLAAVRALVDGPATPAPALAPAWAQPRNLFELREKIRAARMDAPAGAGQEARKGAAKDVIKAMQREQRERELALGAWWMERMRAAADPLAEKMTLYWHGHFATSAVKVRDAYLMWRQNQTFREQARGNFGALAKAMTRDGAMINWLDLQQSRPPHANENFSRELMELFTLGEGHYTEKDVTEGARAFTGYRIDPRDQSFRFALRQHDSAPKEFLGQRGNFDGDAVIDIVLAQPACAQFLANKLWAFFAGDGPASPAAVTALAGVLRASHYEMRPALRAIFTSAEFYAPEVMRAQIKSPVQWMVSTARVLDADLPAAFPMFNALKQMGQIPFAPPSVKGWDGGKAWISTSTLLFRYNLAGAFLHGVGPGTYAAGAYQPEVNPMMAAAIAARRGSAPAPAAEPRRSVDFQKVAPPALRNDPPALVRALALRLFQDPLTPKEEQAFIDYLKASGPTIGDPQVRGLLHLMMSTPHFQLC